MTIDLPMWASRLFHRVHDWRCHLTHLHTHTFGSIKFKVEPRGWS